MMISALLGYLALKSPKSRLVLFLAAIPLAVLGNIARLVMLAYGSVWFGSDFAVGKRIGEHQEMSLYHTCAGFAVFGVALAGMFALCWLLEGREMGANLKRHQKARPSAAGAIAVANPRRTWMQIAAAAALIIVTAGICQPSHGHALPRFASRCELGPASRGGRLPRPTDGGHRLGERKTR
jgi:exosortase/archaeosortase family protein